MKKIQNNSYQEKIKTNSAIFSFNDFKEIMDKMNCEHTIGSIYSFEDKKNLITIYAEYDEHGTNVPYNICIKGKSKKKVNKITKNIAEEIVNHNRELSNLILTK